MHRCDEPIMANIPTENNENDGSNTPKYDPNGTGDWALIRVIVRGTATSTNSPTKEGFIPAKLIGAPCGLRKWLPSGVGSGRRSTVTSANSGAPGKRGSKVDINQSQVINPTSAGENQVKSGQINTTNSEQQQQKTAELGGLLLDNVSEESVDVELPPPMNEIQAPLRSTVNELLDMKTVKESDNNNNNGDNHFLLDDITVNTNPNQLNNLQNNSTTTTNNNHNSDTTISTIGNNNPSNETSNDKLT
ncbi:unnamed protein product [Trichobilharzia regenti]|nr:unnamed protein product [Trichobilharzia regenti]